MPLPDTPYWLDPNDPRAPSQAQWDRMTPEERRHVVESLPSEFPVSEANPPEGDPHFDAKVLVRDVLRRFFRRAGRRVYVANELPVYYPEQPMFAPDVMAVVDVDTHARDHWCVSHEGKGLDWVLEILYSGSRAKDLVRNVERYAGLGIAEYFVFDRRRLALRGYRIPPSGGAYERIVPQGGRYRSGVLGLEIMVEGERVRFFRDLAPVPEADELVGRLEAMVDDLVAKQELAERRAEEEAQRAEEEAQRRGEVEQQLREALAELARLKGR